MATHLLRFSVELSDCELEIEAPTGVGHSDLIALLQDQLHLSTGNLCRELAKRQISLDPVTCLTEYDLAIEPLEEEQG